MCYCSNLNITITTTTTNNNHNNKMYNAIILNQLICIIIKSNIYY